MRRSGFQHCVERELGERLLDDLARQTRFPREPAAVARAVEQASECGTDDFVSKPVNKLELLTRVKSLLRVRHMKSELERALTYLNEIEHDEETL